MQTISMAIVVCDSKKKLSLYQYKKVFFLFLQTWHIIRRLKGDCRINHWDHEFFTCTDTEIQRKNCSSGWHVKLPQFILWDSLLRRGSVCQSLYFPLLMTFKNCIDPCKVKYGLVLILKPFPGLRQSLEVGVIQNSDKEILMRTYSLCRGRCIREFATQMSGFPVRRRFKFWETGAMRHLNSWERIEHLLSKNYRREGERLRWRRKGSLDNLK